MIRDTHGWVLHKLGKHAEALIELEQSLARLPGARVSLAVYGVGSVRETLVTDDAGIATLAGPIGDATSGLACLHGLDLAGYASPPVLEGADLPEGSVACGWGSFP